MYKTRMYAVASFGMVLLLGCGRGSESGAPAVDSSIETVRLHLEGFMKSKSGAT